MSNKFNVGDMVIMTRKPTNDDWAGIGEVDIPPEYYTIPQRIVEITQSRSIVLASNIYSYPACCFELASTATNRTKAKACDYIVILKGHGNSDLEYKTFYVVSVTDGGHFELAEPGKGPDPTIRWACSDPSCYKIKHPSEVVEEHEEKEYSDIGMSNYEPTPREFRVGDRVRVIEDDHFFHVGHVAVVQEKTSEGVRLGKTNGETWWIANHKIQHADEYPRVEQSIVYNVGDTVIGLPSADRHYAMTGQGWEGVIKRIYQDGKHFDAVSVATGDIYHTLELQHFTLKASKSEGLRYKIDLPAFDRTKLEEQYFKTKNQQNGTENQQSVKLQGVNLKIREGNPIRGIRLKSSGSKIKLGSNYRYY